MSHPKDMEGGAPELTQFERIVAACDRYESLARSGEPPPIEQFMAEATGSIRPALLRELLAMELERRRRRGERVTQEEYIARFPGHAETVVAAVAEMGACAHEGPVGDDPAKTPSDAVGEGGKGLPRIQGYEILAELGRGGMGVVYLARRVRLGRPCALKMILAGQHAGPEAAVRFLAEAETIARLRHDGIVQVYGAGDHDGCPYIELEYLEGGSLAQSLDGTPRPAREAAATVRAIADAVGEAHRRGIVHRDLKPANVLLTADGRPKVADFGLAKNLEGAGLTGTDSVLGSPSYMAPEQADGRSRGVGTAADIYALGAIFYHLLTGRPPFKAATVLQTLEQVKNVEPIPPSRLQPGLPRDAETICLKCLRKEPGHRYATAAELAEDLRRFLDGRAILARRSGSAERAWRWCRRNPAVAGLLGSLAALIATSFVVVLVLWLHSEGLRSQSESRRIDAERNALNADAERRHARAESARLALERGIQDCEHDALGPGLLSMARALELAEDSDPKLARVARANLSAWGQEAHRLRNVFDHLGAPGGVAIRPDGHAMAVHDGAGRIRLWDPLSGRAAGPDIVHQSPPGVSKRFLGSAFSPVGTMMATAGEDGEVRLWDAAQGNPTGVVLEHPAAVGSVAFSPDGKLLATGCGDGAVRIWDLARGRSIGPEMRHDHGQIKTLAFSPDGKLLASGGVDTTVRLWRVADGQAVFPPFRHAIPHVYRYYDVNTLAFHPDGRHLATGGEGALIYYWDLATGRPTGRPIDIRLVCRSLSFSPDGRLLLGGFVNNTARVWEFASGRPLGQVLMHDGWVMATAFTSDGRAVVTVGADRAVRVWELADGPLAASPLLFGTAAATSSLDLPHKRVLISDMSRKSSELISLGRPGRGPLSARTPRIDAEAELASFRDDGALVAVFRSDDTVELREVATGRRSGPVIRHPGSPRGLAFSPDGRSLLIGGTDGTARTYDVATGQPVGPLLARHSHWITAAAFHPTGRIVATAGVDQVAQLWSALTGEPLGRQLRHKGWIYGLAFDPTGELLATGSYDMTARVWDTATGLPVGPPLIHATPVDNVAFSPKGPLLATKSHDWSVRLWDYATGLPVGPRLAMERAPQTIGFDPDSGALLVVDASGAQPFAVPPPLEGSPKLLIPRLDAAVGIEPSEEQGNWPISAKAWERDHDQAGGGPFTPRMPAEDWDERESILAEQSGDWFAARWHLDRLVAVRRGEDLRECRARRALVLLQLDEPEAAERDIEAVDRDGGEPSPRFAEMLAHLASKFDPATHARAVERAYRRALGMYERLSGSHPEDLDPRLGLIGTLNNLAYFLHGRGRAAEGKPFASRAVAIAEAHLAPDDYRLGFYLDTLAEIDVAQGLMDEAEPLYRQAVKLCAKLPVENPARAEIGAHYAALLRRRGRPVPVGVADPPAPRR